MNILLPTFAREILIRYCRREDDVPVCVHGRETGANVGNYRDEVVETEEPSLSILNSAWLWRDRRVDGVGRETGWVRQL